MDSNFFDLRALTEQMPSQPILLKQENDKDADCASKIGSALVYCETSKCIVFYQMFEFWYPGCERWIDPKPYRHQSWELDGSDFDRRAPAEHLPSLPMLLKQDISKNGNCTVKTGFDLAMCETAKCIVFFEMFEFLYPGCDYWMIIFKTYWDNRSSICDDDDNGCWHAWLEGNGFHRQGLQRSLHESDVPAPGDRPSLNSAKRLDSNHGPVKNLAESTKVSSLQVSDGPRGSFLYNPTMNTFTCPTYDSNGNFCLGSTYIIRCNNGVGKVGQCNASVMSRPPIGSSYSLCWQTSPTSGDAACSKE
jgi:hypothetical protein